MLRRPLAGALLRLPGAETRALAAVSTRHPAGTTVDRRRHRRDLAGTPCPQPSVRSAGRTALLDEVLGPGFALLHSGPVDPALQTRARTVGARTVRIGGPDGDADATIDTHPVLTAWLQRGRAEAVLLRPDRVVMATDMHHRRTAAAGPAGSRPTPTPATGRLQRVVERTLALLARQRSGRAVHTRG